MDVSSCTCHDERRLFEPLLRVNKTWFEAAARRVWRHIIYKPEAFPDRETADSFFTAYDSVYRGDYYAASARAIHLGEPPYGDDLAIARLTTFALQLCVVAPRLLNVRIAHVSLSSARIFSAHAISFEVLDSLKARPLRHLCVPLEPRFLRSLEWFPDLQSLDFWTCDMPTSADNHTFTVPSGIRSISFDWDESVNDAVVHILNKLDNLQSLKIMDTPTRKMPRNLYEALISKAPLLEDLKLYFYHQPDGSLTLEFAAILKACSQLEKLTLDEVDLDHKMVTEELSRSLGSLSHLKRLRLDSPTFKPGAGDIRDLSLPPRLQKLELSSCHVGKHLDTILAKTPTIVSLEFQYDSFAPDAWVAISKLTSLKELSFREIESDIRFLERIIVSDSLPALESLRLLGPVKEPLDPFFAKINTARPRLDARFVVDAYPNDPDCCALGYGRATEEEMEQFEVALKKAHENIGGYRLP